MGKDLSRVIRSLQKTGPKVATELYYDAATGTFRQADEGTRSDALKVMEEGFA